MEREPNEIPDLAAKETEWPACPKCRTRGLLVAGNFFACSKCDHIGLARDIQPTELFQFARAKMAASPLGHLDTLIILPPDAIRKEMEDSANDQGSLLSAYAFFDPILQQAANSFVEKKAFAPWAILQPFQESDQKQILPFTIDREKMRVRERSLCCDSVAIVKLAEEGELKGALTIELHSYTMAPIAWGIRYFRKEDGSIELGDRFLTKPELPSLVWQPIDWSVIHLEMGRKYPVLLAGLETSCGINLTFSATEDMDGAPSATVSIRTPWETAPAEIKHYPVRSIEEAVKALKEKFLAAQKTGMEQRKLSIGFMMEWPGEPNIHQIRQELRKAPFWADYAKIREARC